MRKLRPVLPHPTDPSLALVELTRGYFAVISAADSEACGAFFWSVLAPSARSQTAYAQRRNGSTSQSLHRLIATRMGLSLDGKIDHINGNGLDCRRSNLRAANNFQSMQNTPMRSDNRSGVKGVNWYPNTNRWVARIAVHGKRICLGYFKSIEEAKVVVACARLSLHGQFASDRAAQAPAAVVS